MMEQMQMGQKKMKQKTQKLSKEKPNNTGIPAQMKHSFESRSGLSFDDVRVHYQSSKPAKIHALAYTQGSDVYIGPGQEQYLQHELGHVVQQKQGRVFPTRVRGGYAFNTSAQLEREADTGSFPHIPVTSSEAVAHPSSAPIQGMIDISYDSVKKTWEVEGKGRPQFSKEVTNFFKANKPHSINHIISSNDISTILAASIKLELTNHSLVPDVYKEAHKGNGSNVRRLIKAVMPREENLVSPDEDRKKEYMEQAYKQREEALQLEDVLNSFFCCDNAGINTAHLKAVANGLESIMFNSFGNLRVGDGGVNQSIQSRIDPLIDTYTIESDGQTPLVIFDEKATDNPEQTIRKRGMAKRVYKLARISDDFIKSGMELPAGIHMPRVVWRNNKDIVVYSSDGSKEEFPIKMPTLKSTVVVDHYKSGTGERVFTEIAADDNSTIKGVRIENGESFADRSMDGNLLSSILGSILERMDPYYTEVLSSDAELLSVIGTDLARELIRQAVLNDIDIQNADDIVNNKPLYCILQSIIIRDVQYYNLNSGKERNYIQELYDGVIKHLEQYYKGNVDEEQYKQLRGAIENKFRNLSVDNIDQLKIAESYFPWYINEFINGFRVDYTSKEHAEAVREEIIDSVYDKAVRRYVSYIFDTWNQMLLQQLERNGLLNMEVLYGLNKVDIKPLKNQLYEAIFSDLNTAIEQQSMNKGDIGIGDILDDIYNYYMKNSKYYGSYVECIKTYLGV